MKKWLNVWRFDGNLFPVMASDVDPNNQIPYFFDDCINNKTIKNYFVFINNYN